LTLHGIVTTSCADSAARSCGPQTVTIVIAKDTGEIIATQLSP